MALRNGWCGRRDDLDGELRVDRRRAYVRTHVAYTPSQYVWDVFKAVGREVRRAHANPHPARLHLPKPNAPPSHLLKRPT
eukprot:scaffold5681_cov30-Tisochrysis_lutea.AAC.5